MLQHMPVAKKIETSLNKRMLKPKHTQLKEREWHLNTALKHSPRSTADVCFY